MEILSERKNGYIPFGCLCKHFIFKGILIGEEDKGELDAIAWDINDNEYIIEFESFSSNFKKHGRSPERCNLIICWKHNWEECPNNIEVIELKHFWELAEQKT